MNEQLEIGGDLQDEYTEIQEAEECNRLAPMRAPLTDAELDDWAIRWDVAQTPDLVRVNTEDDGTPVWEFETNTVHYAAH